MEDETFLTAERGCFATDILLDTDGVFRERDVFTVEGPSREDTLDARFNGEYVRCGALEEEELLERGFTYELVWGKEEVILLVEYLNCSCVVLFEEVVGEEYFFDEITNGFLKDEIKNSESRSCGISRNVHRLQKKKHRLRMI